MGKEGGVFKVLFVVTLEDGRVRWEDKTTMALVLKSAPITHYGVIINKIEAHTKEALVGNIEGARDRLVQLLMSDLPVESPHLYLNMRDEKLAGKKNAVVALDEEMLQFIRNVPSIELPSERLEAIDVASYEATKDNFEGMIQRM